MSRLLLCAALLSSPVLCRASDPALRPVFWQAYAQSRSAVLDSNLILAGAQARLKRLEGTFGLLGLVQARRGAGEAFEEVSGWVERFRPLADSASLDNGPAAPDERRLTPEIRANVRKAPASTTAKIDEIMALRSGYDPSQSRKDLKSAEASLKVVENRLGKPELLLSQVQALRLGREAAKSLCAAAKKLPAIAIEKGPKAELSRKARLDVEGLRSDCEALPVEIERLEILFQLNDAYALDRTLF